MPTLNELNPETWSRLHFGTCELGDVRRTRRLVRYAQQMAEKPDASTPQQTECWSDCKAVYELFRRTEVTFNAVTAAHNRHTLSLPAGKYLATRVHRVASRKRVTESEVWGRVIDRVKSSSRDVQFVHVCDRGADNFDVFAHLHIKGDSWVIRAAQLTRKLHTADGSVVKLGEAMESATLMGTYLVYVSANTNQAARWANVEVRSASLKSIISA